MILHRSGSRSARCGMLAAALAIGPLVTAQSIPYPMMRDHILEIAHDHYVLEWYCSADNLYAPQGGARCDYTVVGWKSGMAYKWGGYDTVPTFLADIADGDGAGDVDSSATVSWTCGDDCSGYVSRCWKSGRYATASFPNISEEIAWEALRPGDALNRPSSHIRLFDEFVGGTGQVLVYETTTGVDPGRTTHRVLTQAQHSSYTPIRYDHVYTIPSLVAARSVLADQVVLHWIGAAEDGFRLYESTDGAAWTRVRDTDVLGPGASSVVVPIRRDGLARLFRMTAVNGGVESPPSVAFPVAHPNVTPRILLVHAFDRAVYLFGGAGNEFLWNTARSLTASNRGFDTVDNLLVQRHGDPAGGAQYPAIDLNDYDTVFWILGRESTAHDAMNRRERGVLTDYLENGGALLIAGSELGYDLVEKKELPEEEDFYRNILRTDYVHDDANTYAIAGTAGAVFAGLSFGIDNGAHGVYAVDYPDILAPRAGAVAALDYQGGRGGQAAVLYEGPVGSGTATARIAHFGFPIETVYDDAARDALVWRTLLFFSGPVKSTLEAY